MMIMDRTEVEVKINEFLIEEFEVDPDRLSADAHLKDSLELDSLDFVDLVVAIEESFGVKLEGEDFVGVKVLEDFYNLIHKKLA